ncbi:PIG-X domain containing protein [Pyrenophora tritici-repentis]|nr:PIG-X domain containing protein [Pyrenophora tritici-repentis]KAI1601005.1 PIG-X domain containing protein [Pyrenophora tritici-repentis]
MKQRITYVVHKPEEFTPEQIEITQDELGPRFALKNVQAAKEHRITLGLDELPSNIGNIFQQWHELHVRWASPKPHAGIPPFTSRVSPGLHVFFTPLSNTPEDALCSQLHWLIPPEVSRDDLKCSTTSSTSTKLPILSERFSMSATSQFYAYLDNIGAYKGPWQSIMCEKGPLQAYCEKLVNAFSTARSVDIDYDTISRSVVLTALWPVAEKESWEKEKGWTSTHRLPSAWMIKHGGLSPNEVPTEDSTVEIGVLSHEGNADPEDIQFGGFLTVLGQDQKPTPSCKLHAHLTLPSYLFIDKYQFTDALFLASKNIKSLRSLSGATDLEAPDWVVEEWGSAALFQLAVPKKSQHASNPFDRTHLGYEGLFGPKTRFLHVDPKPDVDAKGQELIREKLLVGDDWLVEFIKVPVLATGRRG